MLTTTAIEVYDPFNQRTFHINADRLTAAQIAVTIRFYRAEGFTAKQITW